MKKIVKKPLIVLAVGIVLLLASSIGATRATFVTNKAIKDVNFDTSLVLVDLVEGAEGVDSESVKKSGALSFPGIPDDVNIGQKYDEYVDVVNESEMYSEYVRVKVRKYWVKEVDGTLVKDTTLDPSLIKLDIDTSEWFLNSNEHTTEEDVYYLATPLSFEESNNVKRFINGVTIDDKVTRVVYTEDATTEDGVKIAGTIQNVYVYDNANFYVEVEVDAVQTHNAVDAIYGAWGVRVECSKVDDGNITKIDGVATGK